MYLEQPQAIRTIFFDVGFTLLCPYPSDLEICQQVCASLDLHLSEEQLQKRLFDATDFYLHHMRNNRHIWGSESMINEFWIRYYIYVLQPFVEGDEHRLRQLARAINHTYDSHTSWQLYPDVLPTLQALQTSQKYTLGAISDWSISLGRIFQALQLNVYFEHLLISAVTGHSKPASGLYEAALVRANAIADYAIHIGDSYTLDVLGARAVGITPVLLDRKGQIAPEQVDCLLIHSLQDLLPLLEITA
jgi:putative hydrolase of the HAD superfamily